MSLTHRIRPGDPLNADEVEQNFADLDTLISPVAETQIEYGAIHTRHAETANDWRILESKTQSGTQALSGTPVVVVPSAASAYTTVDGQAYLIRASASAAATGANPQVTLRIKVGGSGVIERTWDFPASCTIGVRIAWLAVASASTTTVELEAEGSNATLSVGEMSVLAVRR